MDSSGILVERPKAQHVVITDDSLVVELNDGRTISAPLAWYPRLLHANHEERGKWRLIGSGEGIHWPDLDEDLGIESMVAGSPSGESAESLRRWLGARKKHARGTARGRKVQQAGASRARHRGSNKA